MRSRRSETSTVIFPSEQVRKKKSKGTLSAQPELKDHERLPAHYDDGTCSPILPRVNLAFPLSDEEDVGGGGSSWRSFNLNPHPHSTKTRETELGGVEGGEPMLTRTYSTTTHRTWTYSNSSSRLPPSTTTDDLTSERPRERANSHTHSPIPRNASLPFPPSPTSRRTTSTSSRYPRESKSSSNLRDDHDYAAGRARGGTSTKSYTATDRLFPDFPPPPIDPLYEQSLRARKANLGTSSFSPPVEAGTPFLSPVFNTILVLMFSTIACCSISAVLFGSFALTAMDDAGRRLTYVKDHWGRMQGSIGIEGVRQSVERMLDGASGALGLVSWAAGSGKGLRRSFDLKGKGLSSDPTKSRWRNFGRTVGVNGMSAAARKRGMSPATARRTNSPAMNASPLNSTTTSNANGGNGNRFAAFRTTSFASTSSSLDPSASSTTSPSWHSDEEEDPFLVPPPTPRTSRGPSAYTSDVEHDPEDSPLPDDAASSSSTRGTRSRENSGGALPPRPPLMILIPSIFALVFLTVWKLVMDWLSGSKKAKSSS